LTIDSPSISFSQDARVSTMERYGINFEIASNASSSVCCKIELTRLWLFGLISYLLFTACDNSFHSYSDKKKQAGYETLDC
jgi:hypothetical protein